MSKPIGAKTSMSVGQLVTFTDAEVRALSRALDHVLAEYESDAVRFRTQLRSESAFRRARAKIAHLARRAGPKGGPDAGR